MASSIVCSISGCGRKRSGQSQYCSAHMHRNIRYGNPLAGSTFCGEPLSFATNIAKHHQDADKCVTWPFKRTKYGYGMLAVDGKDTFAHRYICILVHGEPPDPKSEAAHSCGKGHEGCVNPAHLYWATRKQNAEDMVRDGRSCVGEKSGRAKLKDDDVRRIRRLLASGESITSVAATIRVAYITIYRIKNFENWTHVQ